MRLLSALVLLLVSVNTKSQNLDSVKSSLTNSKGVAYMNTAKTIATSYLKINMYDSAEKYYNLTLHCARKIGDHRLIGKCLNNKGVSNYLRGRFKEAVINYQEALEVYRLVNNDTLLSQSLTNLGLTFKGLNIYDKSLSYLYESASILERLGLKKELSSNWNAVGNIHRELNNLDLSIQYLNKSLELRKEIAYDKGIAQSFQNLGIWYLENQEYEKAIDHLTRALRMLREIDKKASASVLAKIGEVFAATDSFSQAEEYFMKSLAIRREFNSANGIAVSSNHLAKLYLKTNRFNECFQTLSIANTSAIESGSLEELSITYKLYTEYYTLMNQLKKALHYSNLRNNLREKIMDKEKARSLIESEIRYEVSRKDEQIKTKDAALTLLENRTAWLVLIIVTLAILLTALVKLYLTSKKLSKERKLNQERVERLLNELNHRTNNHLQSQVTLIKMQGRYLKDGTAKSAIKEVENRMKAITLIHQNLHQSSEDSSAEINLSEYLKNLTENLMISFKYTRNKIRIVYDFEDINSILYYAVPIGLIVNESITNTFKYAFPDQTTSPELIIKLVKNKSNIEISIQDNGKGFKMNETMESKSFGISTMHELAEQIKAKLNIESENGTNIKLLVPIEKGCQFY